MANPLFARAFSGHSTDNAVPTSPVLAVGTINAGEGVVVDIAATEVSSAGLPTITGVTDTAGNAYTKVDSQISAAGFTLSEQWRSTAPAVAGGATSVSVAFTVNSGGNNASVAVDVSVYSSVSAWGLKNKATGAGTAAAVSINTQDANNLVHAALGFDISGTAPVGSGGSTVRGSVEGISNIDVVAAGVEKGSVAPAAVSVAATVPSSDWAMVAIEMRSTAGAGTPPMFRGI